ncbi:MAG: glycoside hydrolase family 65 protein [Propionibacteriaceae bacterium]|jgi:alpha,alpha-trehalose phosphorylase|nr:glycoside hydrolase family 65 protein [Propionibacteriaceae bacterium]
MIDPVDRTRFPADPWKLIEIEGPEHTADRLSATLFALSNGNLGIRGPGEPERTLGNGTFANGFHDTYRIQHAEEAYGLAQIGQVIQGLPDGFNYSIQIDGTELGSPQTQLESGLISLDMREGVLRWTREWSLPGNRATVDARWLVSLTRPGIAAWDVEVKTELPAKIGITESIETNPPSADPDVQADPRRSEASKADGLEYFHSGQDSVSGRAANSRMGFALVWKSTGRETGYSGSDSGTQLLDSRPGSSPGTGTGVPGTSLSNPTPGATCASGIVTSPTSSSRASEAQSRDLTEQTTHPVPGLDPGRPFHHTFTLSYATDPVHPTGVTDGLAVQPDSDLVALTEQARAQLTLAPDFDELADEQRRWLADFWERSDVRVDIDGTSTDPGHSTPLSPDTGTTTTPTQQAIRWSLWQLAQASAQTQAGIAAKGVTGAGYSGHYFWDTEIYVLPFLAYTNPTAARKLLQYRYEMLPAARRRAEVMSVKGALFPWRTIDGEEASAYYPAGTAQYHIDADIAYSLEKYVMVSGDTEFARNQGVEILIETARMWADLGFMEDGEFHIFGVTGPDEYSAVVDDNLYTNAMARHNLYSAARAVEALAEDPVRLAQLKENLHLRADEPADWLEKAGKMHIGWDAVRQIHPQDRAFLQRPDWDSERFPFTDEPLLLRFHPLVIYRHKVLKQADTVLALQLLSGAFTTQEKRADFLFYDALTTGDSTLSAAAQGVVAAEVGAGDKALKYFEGSLFTDLGDSHHNSDSGVHIACAGGVWMQLVEGFGGLRDVTNPVPSLTPNLPPEWNSLEFSLTITGTRIQVSITHEGVQLRWIDGPGATLCVRGHLAELSEDRAEVRI